jgi:molecular chaperone IbpA
MTTIDLTPFYCNSIGFDRLSSLLDAALSTDQAAAGYPPYNIEITDENRYAITLAVAGFRKEDIDIEVENGVLTLRGKKAAENTKKNYLYQGISHRTFERKFNLAEHVEVTGAAMSDGLLTIGLVKEIPEAMKPSKIAIGESEQILGHHAEEHQAA